MSQELPIDLAHLDDLREKITQADEAIVSFICLRVQLGREELAYRRERGLPEWDAGFAHRERTRVAATALLHGEGLTGYWADELASFIQSIVLGETGAVPDGRIDPATDAIPF